MHPNFEVVQLPNKDLWRGYHDAAAPATATEILADVTSGTKFTRAIAAMLASKNGGQIPCLWCGLQFGDETSAINHVKTNHASIASPPTDAEIALAGAAIDKVV